MNNFKSLLVWLCRIKHRLGFGIQSPNDYYFVRHVILENWPYYKYKKLDSETSDRLTRKLGHLYLRLANWRQPAIVVDANLSPYWKAGCQHTIVTTKLQPADIICIQLKGQAQEDISDVIANAGEKTILVIEGIWRNKHLWRQIKQNSNIIVTYDLYYCGLVMFDRQHSKVNYIINF